MSGWIKFEKDLLTDPRVLRIAKSLERRWIQFDTTDDYNGDQYDPSNAAALPAVTLVCGALSRMWCLADTHVDENDILPLGKNDLDDVIGIPGFCDLLPSDWLIVIDDTHVKLPAFHEHNGTEAKKKAVTAKRVERFRNRNAAPLPNRNALALPDQDQDQKKEKTPPNGGPPNVWTLGVSLLTRTGLTERNARGFIGRLIKDYGEPPVSTALAQCSIKSPADPCAYLKQTLQASSQKRASTDIYTKANA